MKKFLRSVKNKASGSTDRRSLSSFGSSSSVSQTNNGSFNSSFTACSGYQVDLEAKDKTFTKLHRDAWRGDVVALQKHLKKCDVNAVDKWRRSPLHLACCQGHTEIVKNLLLHKPDLEIQDNSGNTCLLKAVRCGHFEIITLLVEKGSEINAVDKNGNTALHIAAETNSENIASFLLRKDANLDAINRDGCTPLHLATENENIDMAELLLRHGALVNAKDTFLRTCLMIACYKGNESLITLFLDYNANTLEEDEDGYTAKNYAINSGHEGCLKLLNDQSAEELILQNSQEENETVSLDPTLLLPQPIKDTENEASLKSDLNLNSWNDASDEEISERKGLLNPMKLDKFLLLSGSTSDVNSDNQEALDKESLLAPPPKPPRSVFTAASPRKDTGSLEEVEVVAQETNTENISGNVESFSNKDHKDSVNEVKELDSTTEKQNLTLQEKQKAFMANLGLSDCSERSTSELIENDSVEINYDTDLEDVVDMISVPAKENETGVKKTVENTQSVQEFHKINDEKSEEPPKSCQADDTNSTRKHKCEDKLPSDNLVVNDKRPESRDSGSVKKLQDDETDSNWDSSEELPLSHMSLAKESSDQLVTVFSNAVVNDKQHTSISSQKTVTSKDESVTEKPTDFRIAVNTVVPSNKENLNSVQTSENNDQKVLSLVEELQDNSLGTAEDKVTSENKKSEENISEKANVEQIKLSSVPTLPSSNAKSKFQSYNEKNITSPQKYSQEQPKLETDKSYNSNNSSIDIESNVSQRKKTIASPQEYSQEHPKPATDKSYNSDHSSIDIKSNVSQRKKSIDITINQNETANEISNNEQEHKHKNAASSYPQESIQLRYINAFDENSSYSDNSANGTAVVIKPVMSRTNSLQLPSGETFKDKVSDGLEEKNPVLSNQEKIYNFDSEEEFDDSELDLNNLIFNSDLQLQLLRNDGTLGREDTLQGTDEIWEQNASLEYPAVDNKETTSELAENSKPLSRQNALSENVDLAEEIKEDNGKIVDQIQQFSHQKAAFQIIKQSSNDNHTLIRQSHPLQEIITDVGYQSNDNTPTEAQHTESESCETKEELQVAVTNANSSGYTTETSNSAFTQKMDGFFSKSFPETTKYEHNSLPTIEQYHSLQEGNIDSNIHLNNAKAVWHGTNDDSNMPETNKVTHTDNTTEQNSSVNISRKKGIFVSKSLPYTLQNDHFSLDAMKSYHSLPHEDLNFLELPCVSKEKPIMKDITPLSLDGNMLKAEPVIDSHSLVNIGHRKQGGLDGRGDVVLHRSTTLSQTLSVDDCKKPVSNNGDKNTLKQQDDIKHDHASHESKMTKDNLLSYQESQQKDNQPSSNEENVSEASDIMGLQEVMEHLNIRRRSSANILETIREKGKLFKSTCNSSVEALSENKSIGDDSVFIRRLSNYQLSEEECSPIHKPNLFGLPDLEMKKHEILSLLKLQDLSSVSEVQDLVSDILLELEQEQNRRKTLDKIVNQVKSEKAELKHINNILKEDQNCLKSALSNLECQLESIRWELEKKETEKMTAMTELKVLKDQLIKKESALTEEALKCQRTEFLQGQLAAELNIMRKSIAKENSKQIIAVAEKFPSAAEISDLCQQLDEADQLCGQVLEENKILREQLETSKNQMQGRAEWSETEENSLPKKKLEETKDLLEAVVSNQKIKENAFNEIVLDYMKQINHLKAENEELQKKLYGKHECGFCPHQVTSGPLKSNTQVKGNRQKQDQFTALEALPVEVEQVSHEIDLPLNQSTKSIEESWKFKFEEQERKFNNVIYQLQNDIAQIHLQNKEFSVKIGSAKSENPTSVHLEKVIEKLSDATEKLLIFQKENSQLANKGVDAPNKTHVIVADESLVLKHSTPTPQENQETILKLDYWKEEISRKNSEIISYQNQLQNLQKIVDDEKEKLYKLIEKHNSLKADVDSKDYELNCTKKHLQQIKEEHSNEIHKLKELLHDSNLEKSQIRDNYKIELNEKLQYIKDLEKERRELSEAVAEMKQDLQSVKNQHSFTVTEAQKNHSSVFESQQKIASLETTLNFKEQNLEQLNQMFEMEKEQLEETKKMLFISQANEKQLIAEKQKVEDLFHQTKMHLQTIMKDAEASLAEKNSIIIHLHELENKVDSLEKELESEKKKSKELLQHLEENHKVQKDLEQQISVLKTENVSVVEHLQKEVQNQKCLWENEARSRAELTLQFLNQKKSSGIEDNPRIAELQDKVKGLESLLLQEKYRTIQFKDKDLSNTESQAGQDKAISEDSKKIEELEKKLQEIQNKFKHERKVNQNTTANLIKLKRKLDDTRQQLKLKDNSDKNSSLQSLLQHKSLESISHHQIEELRKYYEEVACQEFNSKLQQIYAFLKEQNSTKEQLEMVRLNNEVQLRSSLQHSKNELLEEIANLRTSLNDSQAEVETLREQCKHLHELYNAEVKLNSRMTKDLMSSPQRKSLPSSPLKNNKMKRPKSKAHSSKQDSSPERFRKEDLLRSSWRSKYDNSAIYKLKAELNKSILQHLQGGSVNDNLHEFGTHTASSGFKSS